jgi:ABC-type cobalt transport system substrate-binding protein
MPQNSMRKNIFWLLWTISLIRMGLLIWSGTYFQAKTLGHTSPYSTAFVYKVYSPLHQSLFTPASKFIHPCIKVYSPLHQNLFTPASKLIHPCIKVYSPLHQSLFSPALKSIHPCIKVHSPLHQNLFTPKCTQNGTKRSGSGQDVWPNILTYKKAPYQINRPILVGEMVQNNHKIVFYAILGHFGTLKWTQKVPKGLQLAGCMAQCLSLKISPIPNQ